MSDMASVFQGIDENIVLRDLILSQGLYVDPISMPDRRRTRLCQRR